MATRDINIINKSRKVLLPGIQFKDLKPISSLIHPSNIIMPLLLISILAQISDNLKGILGPKDIQRLSSVKFYSKILYSGFNSVALSAIFSLSKTLGPEVETLSALTVSERLNFLRALQKKIIFSKSQSKIISNFHTLYNPNELIKHRKGLATQFRSTLVANSLFAAHSIVLGMNIANVNLYSVVESAKLLWFNLGLDVEEFDFLLRKQSLNSLKKLEFDNFDINNDSDCLKILALSEFMNYSKSKKFLIFDEDMIVLKAEKNLTLLEKELGFVERVVPELPKDSYISDDLLKDNLIRAAFEQKKTHKLLTNNISDHSNISGNKTKYYSNLRNTPIRKSFNAI